MRARLRVRAEAVPRVRRVFKERMSLLLKVKGCAFLGILKEYDKKAGLSKNLAYAVLNLNESYFMSRCRSDISISAISRIAHD